MAVPTASDFKLYTLQVNPDSSKVVDNIEIVLEVSDHGGGDVYFTDIMFQSGTVATSWVGHVSEIRWSFDNA